MCICQMQIKATFLKHTFFNSIKQACYTYLFRRPFLTQYTTIPRIVATIRIDETPTTRPMITVSLKSTADTSLRSVVTYKTRILTVLHVSFEALKDCQLIILSRCCLIWA